MSSEGEIINAKRQFYTSSEPTDQAEVIDIFAAYGERAIEPITEVISLSHISDQVREYGLRTIEGIRGHS